MPSLQLPLAEAVSVRATGPDRLHVSWKSPPVAVGGGTLLKYSFRLLRRRKGRDEFVVAHQQSDIFYEHEITGLQPFSEYEVAVQTFSTSIHMAAAGDTGEDDLPTTKPVSCRTGEHTPGVPRSFAVTDVTTDTITVSWKPPRKINGLLKGYRLYFDQEASTEFNVVELQADASSYTARHLFTETVHRFQLLAFTAAGEGPCTRIIEQQTRTSALNRFKLRGGDDWVQRESVVDEDDEKDQDDEEEESATMKTPSYVHRTPQRQPSSGRSGFRVVAPTVHPSNTQVAVEPEQDKPKLQRPLQRRLSETDWRSVYFAETSTTRNKTSFTFSTTVSSSSTGEKSSHVSSPRSFSVIPPVHGTTTTSEIRPHGSSSNAQTLSPSSTSSQAPRRRLHSRASAFLQPPPPSSSPRSASSSEILGIRTLSAGVCARDDGTDDASAKSRASRRLPQDEVAASELPSQYSSFTPPVISFTPSHMTESAVDASYSSEAVSTTSAQQTRNRLSTLTPPAKSSPPPPTPEERMSPKSSQKPNRKPCPPHCSEETDILVNGETGETFLASLKMSGTRTIRGKKHGVRKTLQHLQAATKMLSSDELSRIFDMEAKSKRIVLYITTTTGVRETFQACEEIKAIFYNLRLKVEIRNIAMDRQAKQELEKRLPGAIVPQAFLEGVHLGDAATIKRLNETGELRSRLQDCEERPTKDCSTCGGQGYILCTWCQGSKRSIRHAFAHSTKEASLRCTLCNENALQRCPDC
eukprot:m.131748 g.131748  ORF g.131748 m.131748 type:complete len:751 (+) comp15755_c0_seq1:154-2406(+)